MANGYNNPFMAFYEKPRNISNVIGQGLGMYADSQNQKAAEADEEQKQVRAFAYMTKASELAGSDPAASEQAFMLAMKESPEFVTGILQAKKMRSEATGSDSSAAPTSKMQEYNLAKSQGYEGSFIDYQNQSKGESKTTTTQQDFDRYQKLKKEDPDAAEQFGKAAGFVSTSGDELSVHMQKRLSDSTDAAVNSRSTAERVRAIAAELTSKGGEFGGGLFGGSWGESLKKATGNEDAESDLRRKYYAIRGSQVVKNLPPGAASDKDIELALAGFPSDNANSKTIASFLEGVAKLEDVTAEFNEFKAQYISDNGTERGMLADWKKSKVDVSNTSQNKSKPVKSESVNWSEM